MVTLAHRALILAERGAASLHEEYSQRTEVDGLVCEAMVSRSRRRTFPIPTLAIRPAVAVAGRNTPVPRHSLPRIRVTTARRCDMVTRVFVRRGTWIKVYAGRVRRKEERRRCAWSCCELLADIRHAAPDANGTEVETWQRECCLPRLVVSGTSCTVIWPRGHRGAEVSQSRPFNFQEPTPLSVRSAPGKRDTDFAGGYRRPGTPEVMG
ncbi:hypothetical protein C8R44DRAFT_826070 [Mycena epipterygia]|nr:hypothetical protein C8R44DRAFT_826070 [Mycena epipterygia]